MTTPYYNLFSRLRNTIVGTEEIDSSIGGGNSKLFFLLLLTFYILYLSLFQSKWVFSGEMWAEMATNYFTNSLAPQLHVRLFSTDAGYIPLPQRIIATFGSSLALPARAIPYYYTWAGIVGTGLLVGSFCLAEFRSLVRSDGLRFAVALAILLPVDFETRTFINFTYFGAFFCAVVTALAYVERTRTIPAWSWFVPFLMISKPALLAVLPAMIIVSITSGTRFRAITITTLFFCAAQFMQIWLSHSGGQFSAANHFSFYEKIDASVRYTLGISGAFLLGLVLSGEYYKPVMLGSLLLALSTLVLLFNRSRSSALILVGLCLISFNVVLNCFALPDAWNSNMSMVQNVPVYRHIQVALFGEVLLVVGLIEASCGRFFGYYSRRFSSVAGLTLFTLWFVFSGWLPFSGRINRLPESPALGNSQWSALSSKIDAPGAVCVPIDPYGWYFTRGCGFLNADPASRISPFTYGSVRFSGISSVTFEAHVVETGKHLISISFPARSHSAAGVSMTGTANVISNGVVVGTLSGSKYLDAGGGSVYLSTSTPIKIEREFEIRLEFNSPVDLGISADDKVAVTLLGN